MSHIHLWVSDLDRSVRFYSEAFGMTERFRRDGELVSLTTPGTNDSVSLSFNPGDLRPKGQMGTIAHFGFRLAHPEAIDESIGEILAAGGTLIERGEPGQGQPTYVADPDGYLIEL